MSSTLLAQTTEHDSRWPAVVARDATANGSFYYSVRTTGVYCLPSCRARLARPENVRFHRTREDAERAGFRPCRRCRPDQFGDQTHDEMHVGFADSSLGLVALARNTRGGGISAVLFGDSRDALLGDLRERFPRTRFVENASGMTETLAWIIDYIESSAHGTDRPLDMRGTEFQRRVWQALREIPAGSTATYAEIARRIGRPQSVRAVAQACAANALAVLVPCHRVVRSDGELSGYRWGVDRKRTLLAREREAVQ
jgi:AraC family transcriptional regulator of adaptative response/methylated-DNA-[protein]-cysteine methyltransferase